jgi:CHAT domain-containing protein
LEAEALRAVFYPDATLLGRRAPRATPQRVLDALPSRRGRPGAALIHLACHAQTAPSPAGSHLRLTADSGRPAEEPLPVDQILRQAGRRPPGAPGGLVVLAACVSDLSVTDYDEALTLASAFLTAGAVTVVGTRWPVADLSTAIMMFMFHHYLNAGLPPAQALGQAQGWMLDAGRQAPAGMPAMLADAIARQDLGELAAWAAFTHQGR